MSKKSTYLLWILLTIIIGCFLSWWLCCNSSINGENSNKINGLENSEVNVATSLKEGTKNPFSITDSQTGFSLTSNKNFNFNTSKASILTPVSDEVNSNLDKIKAYLQENPNITLDVVGHYKSDETNTTSFDNLGLARSNSIKEYLVFKGISEDRISTKSMLNDTINADENSVLYGPVTFNLLGNSAESATITNKEEENNAANAEEDAKAKKAALKASILSNPLVFNFEHSEFNYTTSDTENKKIANIVMYLNNTEGASLSIIGHTDSSGSAATNNRLGQNRADFVKSILVKKGAPANKIKTFSKGESNPIATNTTEAGKRKNRRIEYKLN
jgi:outer membrane protein OmpA-like peptidoglycan-associated protein